MKMTDDEHLEELRIAAEAVEVAEYRLAEAVASLCPAGPDGHSPVQHRDRKPPWCPSCGRDWRGVKHKDSA